MAPLPEPVLPAASALLIALGDLTEGSDAPVCRLGFAFGAPPPADACCECPNPDPQVTRTGQAWVRVGTIWQTKVFPQPLAVPVDCGDPSLAAVFTAGIYRCAPTLDDAGMPPSPAELAAALDRQLQDAALLRAAVTAAYGPDPGMRPPAHPRPLGTQ